MTTQLVKDTFKSQSKLKTQQSTTKTIFLFKTTLKPKLLLITTINSQNQMNQKYFNTVKIMFKTPITITSTYKQISTHLTRIQSAATTSKITTKTSFNNMIIQIKTNVSTPLVQSNTELRDKLKNQTLFVINTTKINDDKLAKSNKSLVS
jgi:hypothetical protein